MVGLKNFELSKFKLVGAPAEVKIELSEESLVCRSLADAHYYIPYNRTNDRYRLAPEEASFDISEGLEYEIEVKQQSDDGQVFNFMIIEYFDEHDKVVSSKGDRMNYSPTPGVKSVSLILRVKGKGVFKLFSVTCRPLKVIASQEVESKAENLEVFDDFVGELPSNFVEAGDHSYRYQVNGGCVAKIEVSSLHELTEAKNVLLTAFTFIEADGSICMPSSKYAINPRFGNYFYLENSVDGKISDTSVLIDLPVGVSAIELRIVHWAKSYTAAHSKPVITELVEQGDSYIPQSYAGIERFLQSISVGKKLIVLYTTAPYLEHETLELRPNRLAKEYAKLGHAVVFFPFSKVPDGLDRPYKEFGLVAQFNRDLFSSFVTLASQRKGADNIFICSSFPDVNALTAITRLKLSSWNTVYEIRDDMEEFNRVGYSKWYHTRLEAEVGSLVDKVAAVSPRLAKKIDWLGAQRGDALVIPNAASGHLIEKGMVCHTEEILERRNVLNKVGYIGHLTLSWFDWSLIINTAKSMPATKFEIIGHGMPGNIVLPHNVVFLGPKSHDEFVEISKEWKVGLIPFKPSPLTFAVDPNKVYEHLAVGIRTVTARMGSVEYCPSTLIYSKNSQFQEVLKSALATDLTMDEVAGMREFLDSANWAKRAEQMLEMMG
jgi:hypothetical protein